MRFHVISLFPESFDSYISASIIGRAVSAKTISVDVYNPRTFTKDKHRRTDYKPYAGGPGMVMFAEPIILAMEKIIKGIEKKKIKKNGKIILPKIKVIITSATGNEFTNAYAKKVSEKYTDIIIVCGRYEGIDARVITIAKALARDLKKKSSSAKATKDKEKILMDVEEISIGNYILTGGELPAMVMIDTISRQIEGVLGKIESLEESRISSTETYTRPEILVYKTKKYKVPKVLLSGNHKLIDEWRENSQSKKLDK
jgi:tRNA (guanine37-N1)-methyltransferase